jgi:hypothetical protein
VLILGKLEDEEKQEINPGSKDAPPSPVFCKNVIRWGYVGYFAWRKGSTGLKTCHYKGEEKDAGLKPHTYNGEEKDYGERRN